MTEALSGKVALITGAARGQGAAEARLFVEQGARVIVADILEDEARAVARSLGDAALFMKLDVTQEADWEAAVAAGVQRFGKLDVLVNNAGISFIAPIAETTLEAYRRIVEINQVGVFLGMRTVIDPMTKNGGGSIINISSTVGLVGLASSTAYTATKFAVRGMTKSAALELAGLGIRVNSVHPGFIDTPMSKLHSPDPKSVEVAKAFFKKVPLGRVAQPEEVAPLVAFLASDQSAYCTGGEFAVDGGFTTGVVT